MEAQASQGRAIIAFQLHKSLGLSVLALSLVRLIWRLLHPAPAPPPTMAPWERRAAQATHAALYLLMLALPFSGWLYVSTQWRGDQALNLPTLWFGWFEVPHLFGLDELAAEQRRAWAALGLQAHEFLAWSMAILLGLHVAAALKHHFVNRDQVLARMLPLANRADGLASPPSRARRLIFAAASLAAVASAAGLLWQLYTPASEHDRGSAAIRTAPGGWLIDANNSHIGFSGSHAGTAFEGRFSSWQAALMLDAEAPEQSTITASIDTASASDGIPLHDQTLRQPEWFDVDQYPQAHFRSTRISRAGANRYQLTGVLQIKQQMIPVSGLWLELGQDSASIRGQLTIKRSEANLGMESDPDAQWISEDILVDVLVRASRP